MKEKSIDKNNTFELKLEKLKEIVESLEEGKLSLEESLKYFEEGIKLYRSCNKVLNSTEQKITLLLSEDDDSKEIPFMTNQGE